MALDDTPEAADEPTSPSPESPPVVARAEPPQAVGRSMWRIAEASSGDPEAGGVVGFGADLKPSTLVDAYRRGIFPWPHPGVAVPWFSPDPRAVLPLDGLRVTRSLRQRMRRCGWTTTVDAAFDEVVVACAHRAGGEGTWIGRDMAQAYSRLCRLGWAHSVEVWDGDELVGGLYGVAVGGCFTGESMFHRATDASKVALVDLVDRWAEAGGSFVDVQLPTAHLASLGAVVLPRAAYLSWLESVRDRHVPLVLDRLPVARLAEDRPPGPSPDTRRR